ncbi:hypothetical protein ELQ90_16435 [Labedella phragmitis]|uniref:Uncharacterized protein n=1 Tax=Labedella phragmitis TaxID=2498849 RepID=A0A444PNL3_9MICO|nr:hypothetical protein [Labedella phragmitis]RWZ45979.1 hypothetical protein ELQ90_16435 [Labedella phragmitis]
MAEELRAFHVHPAFTGPLEIGSEVGAGLVVRDLPESWASFTETHQLARLSEMWFSLCEWGEDRGVDEVLIDSFSCSGNDILTQRGFTIPHRTVIQKFLSPALCGPASLSAEPKRVKERLLPLIDIPVVQLRAFVRRQLVFEVYDASWDSMIAYANERSDLQSLSFAHV